MDGIYSVTWALSDEYCQANITKSKTSRGVSFTGVWGRVTQKMFTNGVL